MSTDSGLTLLLVLVAAVVAVGALSGGVAGAEELTVGVSQADDGSATVLVTDENATGVENATVDVEASDTYSGTGTDSTDANGTVDLPAPETNVTINVTATKDNVSATTTETLIVAETNQTNETVTETNESFGQAVSAYVFSLQNDSNVTGGLGPQLATWVVANNPGNAPDHAGPPENMTRGPPGDMTRGPPENTTRGPPEDTTRGPPENKTQSGNGGGPPESAGQDGDAERANGGNNGSGNSGGGANGGGPPAGAGPN